MSTHSEACETRAVTFFNGLLDLRMIVYGSGTGEDESVVTERIRKSETSRWGPQFGTVVHRALHEHAMLW